MKIIFLISITILFILSGCGGNIQSSDKFEQHITPKQHVAPSYKKGQLKGRLKEIAATLDEESNPVIMLIKHKK